MRSADGGIGARHETNRAAQQRRHQWRRRVQHRRPQLIGRYRHHNQHAQAGAQNAANDAKRRAFQQKLSRNVGARRANAVMEYLISQGVAPNRLRFVSYGKERPVELCSDEACYSKNRRAVTVVTQGAGA